MFEFECTQCSTVHEEITNDRELAHINCDVCGGVATKIMSVAGWDLKGGGVYRSSHPSTYKEKPKPCHKRVSSGG